MANPSQSAPNLPTRFPNFTSHAKILKFTNLLGSPPLSRPRVSLHLVCGRPQVSPYFYLTPARLSFDLRTWSSVHEQAGSKHKKRGRLSPVMGVCGQVITDFFLPQRGAPLLDHDPQPWTSHRQWGTAGARNPRPRRRNLSRAKGVSCAHQRKRGPGAAASKHGETWSRTNYLRRRAKLRKSCAALKKLQPAGTLPFFAHGLEDRSSICFLKEAAMSACSSDANWYSLFTVCQITG